MSSEMTQNNPYSSEDLHPILVRDLGKCYEIYAKPKDRLKQALWRGRRSYYREFWALRNISLEIRTGETVAIIGRNGSGKSTLLQMICGTLAPTEGSVKTSGTIAALLELGSGFNPEFTGIENVFLNASLLGLTQEQIRAKMDDIQAFADIGDFVNQPVKTYSSGMLVRLAFAVVAHVDPSVLIVDEALSVGDAVFGQRCMRFIRRFTEKGTLLFVSHDLNAVSSLCERAVWLDAGNLRLDDKVGKVLTAYTRYCLEQTNAEVKRNEQARLSQDISEELANEPTSKAGKQYRETLDEAGSLLTDTQNPEQCEIAHWDSERDYGSRKAFITDVTLITQDGEPTLAPVCGEPVTLRISSVCNVDIKSLLAGFIIRDRTGQIVFGENTIGQKRLTINRSDTTCICFKFVMPVLHPGSYSLSAAVSDGDELQFETLHYKPDVLVLTPNVRGRPVHGVFAITKMAITSEVQQNDDRDNSRDHS
jgi:lipopolysaccharide transport system ATP-binding protein